MLSRYIGIRINRTNEIMITVPTEFVGLISNISNLESSLHRFCVAEIMMEGNQFSGQSWRANSREESRSMRARLFCSERDLKNTQTQSESIFMSNFESNESIERARKTQRLILRPYLSRTNQSSAPANTRIEIEARQNLRAPTMTTSLSPLFRFEANYTYHTYILLSVITLL
jgi:hypothetical protein